MTSPAPQGSICQCGKIKISRWSADPHWNQEELEPNSVSNDVNLKDAKLVILYPSANKMRRCEQCKEAFTRLFNIPELWWENFKKRSNGYLGTQEIDPRPTDGTRKTLSWSRLMAKSINTPEARHVNKNELNDTQDVSQYLYSWHKLNTFVSWDPALRRTMIMVCNAPAAFNRDRFEKQLGKLFVHDKHSTFWVYPALLDEYVRIQNQAVWDIRTAVRKIEKRRDDQGRWSPTLNILHDLARHAIHATETVDNAVDLVEGLLGRQRQDISRINALNQHRPQWTASNTFISDRLSCYLTLLQGLSTRSVATKKRLENEISLAFNMTSLRIAQSTEADSKEMKSLSVLTMLFLPATFVAAVMSTSFFDFKCAEEGEWCYSTSLWIYWVVAVVLMFVVFMWHWGKLDAFTCCCTRRRGGGRASGEDDAIEIAPRDA